MNFCNDFGKYIKKTQTNIGKHVAYIGNENAQNIISKNYYGIMNLENCSRIWEDSIGMCLTEIWLVNGSGFK